MPVEHPTTTTKPKSPMLTTAPLDDDTMQLDNTKHKVYIYDLDAELSDSDQSDDGKLIFLPDIQKHLRETRIPPSILANSEGELAGMNNQLVLYNIPSSLTVPEEKDSVRKAIIESRARQRALQEHKLNGVQHAQADVKKTVDAREWYRNMVENGNGSSSTPGFPDLRLDDMVDEPTTPLSQRFLEDDPDAMDLG